MSRRGDLNCGGIARARTSAHPPGTTCEPTVPPTRRRGVRRGPCPRPFPTATHRRLQHNRADTALHHAARQRDLVPHQARQVTRVHTAGGAAGVRHRRHGAGVGGRGGRFEGGLEWRPLGLGAESGGQSTSLGGPCACANLTRAQRAAPPPPPPPALPVRDSTSRPRRGRASAPRPRRRQPLAAASLSRLPSRVSVPHTHGATPSPVPLPGPASPVSRTRRASHIGPPNYPPHRAPLVPRASARRGRAHSQAPQPTAAARHACTAEGGIGEPRTHPPPSRPPPSTRVRLPARPAWRRPWARTA